MSETAEIESFLPSYDADAYVQLPTPVILIAPDVDDLCCCCTALGRSDSTCQRETFETSAKSNPSGITKQYRRKVLRGKTRI